MKLLFGWAFNMGGPDGVVQPKPEVKTPEPVKAEVKPTPAAFCGTPEPGKTVPDQSPPTKSGVVEHKEFVQAAKIREGLNLPPAAPVVEAAPIEAKPKVSEPPKRTFESGRLMTMSEAIEEFKLTEERITIWVGQKKLRVFKASGKILLPADDIAALANDKVPAEIKVEVAPPEPDPPVVEFKNVTKTYAGDKPYTAIKDVTFCVEDLPNIGELIAILGPSGCGKSTVLKLIAGLEPQFPHTSGEVLVLGQPVTAAGADRGMVFQEYSAFDNRTVLDNVAFGLECRGVGRRERHEMSKHWIEKVGLNAAKDSEKYPHQLSGGMRQRVAIARSLVLNPRILLMDEPFGALDPMTRFRMQDLLIGLWKNSETTVFFVTHDIPEAVFLGDRIYLFSNAPGTIIEQVFAPRPELPAILAREEADFQDRVKNIRVKISKMEAERGII